FGLIHKSAFWEKEEYDQAREGQVINTYFHGFTEEGKLIFGSFDFQGEWRTGELDALIGTVQKVTVKINMEGKKEFFVNDTYKATLPILSISVRFVPVLLLGFMPVISVQIVPILAMC